MFFGSGVNNFGVMEVLDALVDLAPPPQPRTSTTLVNRQPVVKEIQPEDKDFAGVVFKVQANMDANHRDRIAFVRMASGKYTPGMKLKVQRTAKELRPTSVVTFMSQRREAVEEAYAGDIVGFTTHGGVQLGDTITDGAIAAVHRPALLRARALHDGDPARTRCAPSSCSRAWRSSARKARSRCSGPRSAARCCWARSASCSSKWCSTA